ncbi:MAG: universal stress protein [Streptococcaceae bacterium]|jgi:nucleotide-binding universal stress UspA family protein|nr:universal stress protein [Streptococcaceae bacterium]
MLQNYKTILVAIDGSDAAEIAFKKAVNVAMRNEAKLLLAHVIDLRAFQSVASFDGILAEQAEELAKKTLDEYVDKANVAGLTNLDTVIEYGSPKAIIAKELPEKYEVDLIMLGATGLNAIERLLVGSVSEYVIRHSPCDVLIVRTDLDNKTPSVKK